MKLRDFDIVRYDGNMATGLTDGKDVVWHDMEEHPFRLGGLAFHAPGKTLRRLPEVPEGAIPEAVDMLAWHTSGANLGFRTDSELICLRVKLECSKVMDHMTAIGSAGFDLYMGAPERRIFCASTRFPANDAEYSVKLISLPAGGMREFLLDFPLYSNVKSLEIGLRPGARIEAPSPWRSGKRVVVYGTSITQGGCASRPGMCMTNILSRRWNMEFVNLGFSGSGKGEPEVIELVASVSDPALFILDYEVNAGLNGFRDTLPGTIDITRTKVLGAWTITDNSTLTDELIITTISVWCNMMIGNPPNAEFLRKAYEGLKGRLRLSKTYTKNYGGVPDEDADGD